MKWPLSYWEQDLFSRKYDLIIVGAGFSGMATAFFMKEHRPDWKILVLDKAVQQRAASSRNAGLACISSLSELMEDVAEYGWDNVLRLIEWRWKGLEYIKEEFDHGKIAYKRVPSGEVFIKDAAFPSEKYLQHIDEANYKLKDILGLSYYQLEDQLPAHIKAGEAYISHAEEGQLHPARLLKAWTEKCRSMHIEILEACEVFDYKTGPKGDYTVASEMGKICTKRILFCTNGKTIPAQSMTDLKVVSNLVLVSKPFEKLDWQANLHAESGYLYARNIGDRILVGGGRHLLDSNEQLDPSEVQKDKLRAYLKRFACEHLTNVPQQWESEFEWLGYLGTGSVKEPIMKATDNNIFVLGRLSGMGVALSSYLGKQMAKMIDQY